MKTLGIVTEYNPFHKGHAYMIEEAKKKAGADRVVVIMSGSFVQRGEPAIFDKWTRTEAALKNGVDLSRAFVEGGIHEAIMEYENNVFFDILAEDLARRDMDGAPIDENNYAELTSRIDAYIAEFEQHGTDNILVDIDT